MTVHDASPSDRARSPMTGALQRMRATRGRARQFWTVFDRSLTPMVMVDGERRYLAANAAARLLFRLSQEELRALRIEDLTPPHILPVMHERWAQLMRTGTVSGPYEVGFPDGSRIAIVYCALANALPGQHLIVFTPADWPGEELQQLEAHEQKPLSGPLSPREREVLSLIAAGCGSRQIAEELTISPLTAKTHVEHALRKLGARNRAHAIAVAMRHGLIDVVPHPAASEAPGSVGPRAARDPGAD